MHLDGEAVAALEAIRLGVSLQSYGIQHTLYRAIGAILRQPKPKRRPIRTDALYGQSCRCFVIKSKGCLLGSLSLYLLAYRLGTPYSARGRKGKREQQPQCYRLSPHT